MMGCENGGQITGGNNMKKQHVITRAIKHIELLKALRPTMGTKALNRIESARYWASIGDARKVNEELYLAYKGGVK